MSGFDVLCYTLLAALANWQILEIWRHGSVFAGYRAYLELYEGKLVELLLCTFCLSNWTALGCTAAVFALACPAEAFEWWYLAAWIPTAFAVARLSNLFNDLVRPVCRTPNRTEGLEGVDNLESIGGGLDVGGTRGTGGADESAEERA